jgi:superfamily I DNA/RNA helicase
VAFTRVINTPKRGIGEESVKKIFSYAKKNKCTLIEAASKTFDKGKIKKSVEEFLNIIEKLSEEIEIRKPEDLICDMLQFTNYIDHIKATEDSEISQGRIENIEELISLASSFETMEELTENITLDSSWSSILYISFLIFVLVHNIAHILQTILLKTYTPGLYTSILLVSPYTVYLLIRLVS